MGLKMSSELGQFTKQQFDTGSEQAGATGKNRRR